MYFLTLTWKFWAGLKEVVSLIGRDHADHGAVLGEAAGVGRLPRGHVVDRQIGGLRGEKFGRAAGAVVVGSESAATESVDKMLDKWAV